MITELEKIGLESIRALLIESEVHFIEANRIDSPENYKDSEWVDARNKLDRAIKLLTRAIDK